MFTQEFVQPEQIAQPEGEKLHRIFEEILVAIQEAVVNGEKPVAILDLDHTLFDNGGRTLKILMEFARVTNDNELLQSLQTLEGRGCLPYLMRDIIKLATGVEPSAEFMKEVGPFWKERFFASSHIQHDRPMDGAKSLTDALVAAGATIVYLTGRHDPDMRQGTLDSFQAHGFPMPDGEKVHLLLKPDFKTSDADYKAAAVQQIRQIGGRVVTSVDNEPGMCNIMKQAFPEAIVILCGDLCAPNPPTTADGIKKIGSFLQD